MKKSLARFCLAATLVFTASPSFATFKHSSDKVTIKQVFCHLLPKVCAKLEKAHGKPKAHAVPEIDAANAALALALVGGLVAIRRERRNRS